MAKPTDPLAFFDILRRANVLRGDSSGWLAWRAFIASLFGLPLSDDELAVFKECTGRGVAPSKPATEGWLVCGRRAGKSFTLSLIATWLACFRDYRPFLS